MNKLVEIQDDSTSSLSVIQQYFTAFGHTDWDAAIALMAEDVVWHVDGHVDVSTVGLLQGREQVRRWLEDFPRNFKPRVFKIDKLLESDGDVIAFGRFRHEVLSTRRTVGSDLVIRFGMRNGQIARYQIFEDSALLARGFEPADRWDQKKIKLNHVVYSYIDKGEGPVVIFAHGLFVDHTIFDAQVAALENSHRCIVLDMPGHGASGFRADGWTLDDISSDIALMVDELSLGPITFVGQSQGGMAGIRLAARRPELVCRLVLVGTSARGEFSDRIEHWQALRHTILHGSDEEREAAFFDVQHRLNGLAWLQQRPDEAARERTIMLSHDRIGVTLALDAATIKREGVCELLPSITAPTLVICGAEDRATPPELSLEIVSGIPAARIEILAGVGHHPPLEAPHELAALIEGFLNLAPSTLRFSS
jgi:pimeloyl-ACP methyl ester carboxylesterase/ketosteroid isomerase-like protein